MIEEAVISEPGNLAPVRVPIVSVQCGWEINNAGSFSGFAREDDLRAVGLAGDIKGYWLTYDTAAGPWGGVITGQPSTGGVTEIAAAGWLELVRGRIITNSIIAMGGSAGGLARRALTLAGAGNPAFLRLGSIDEGGGPVAVELVGDVGSDILPQIADAGDVEWIIDADRTFRLARRLGEDKSMTVRLIEDRHFTSPRVNDDLTSDAAGQAWRVQGELSRALAAFGRPNEGSDGSQSPLAPTWEPRGSVPGQPWQSLPEGLPVGATAARIGYRSGAGVAWRIARQRYEVEAAGVASSPASNAAPAPWLGLRPGVGANHPGVAGRRHMPAPTVPCELTLANRDGCWAWFDLGDTVRIELGNGRSGRFRPLVQALDVASGALTVSGDLLRDW
ncbi:MAG: hypothetical protein AB7R89_31750 [Dehalococcoidia bacterium]